MQGRAARIWLRLRQVVATGLDEFDEGVVIRLVRLPAARRRHFVAAHLAQYFLPDRAVGLEIVEIQRPQIEARARRDAAVTPEAKLIEKLVMGRLGRRTKLARVRGKARAREHDRDGGQHRRTNHFLRSSRPDGRVDSGRRVIPGAGQVKKFGQGELPKVSGFLRNCESLSQ